MVNDVARAKEGAVAQPTISPPLIEGEWLPMTFEEFLEWAPDGRQAEWVDGRGIIFVSTNTRHGRLLEFFAGLLGTYLRVFGLGELFTSNILMRLPSRPSGRMPDIIVVLEEHRERVGEQWLEGPADFAIEFLSDETLANDRRDKRREYAEAGIPEYLMIAARPGRDGFEYLRLGTGRAYADVVPDALGRYHSAVLPGFWIDPNWLSRDPLPAVEDVMMEIAPDDYLRRIQRAYDARRPRSDVSAIDGDPRWRERE
jgi:Uma2 family endonuclease